MEIQNLKSNKYRELVNDHIKKEWGLPIVTRGNIIDVLDLPGYVAIIDNELAGAILYQIRNNECEIVVLFSFKENIGLGSALLNSVTKLAKEQGCKRVWLITTNDNTHAIRYYQKRGFSLKALHINASKITQKIKGIGGETILGIDDIPILHEVEFEMLL